MNLPIVVSSISNGWSSGANILLTSDKTPLPGGKISMDEASWIASLIYVGGNVIWYEKLNIFLHSNEILHQSRTSEIILFVASCQFEQMTAQV